MIDIILKMVTRLINAALDSADNLVPKKRSPEEPLPEHSTMGFQISYNYSILGLDEACREIASPMNLPSAENVETEEPLVDIIETDEELKVYALLPAVEEDDVNIEVTDDGILLSVKMGDKIHRKKIPHPEPPRKIEASWNNGVLEITLRK